VEPTEILVALVVEAITVVEFIGGLWNRVKNLPRVLRGHPVIPSRTLAVVPQPLPRASGWSDGTVSDRPATMLYGRLLVTNITERMVGVPAVKLRKPKMIAPIRLSRPLPEDAGTQLLSPDAPTELDFLLFVQPPVGRQGRPFVTDIAVIDHFGNHHWLRKFSFEPPLEKENAAKDDS
jgi:hypothetical protein